MGPPEKHPWLRNALDPILPIGEKNGRKRSLLSDGNGIPLSLVVAGANRHDRPLLAPTLDSIVVKPPMGTTLNLCTDAGYKGAEAKREMEQRGYVPHTKGRREEAAQIKDIPGLKARRWVVERTHSWMNRSPKLLVSFEKSELSYTALVSLSAALICWRQTISIYG
jgi:putative transposase